jgi:hypothetical protein
MEFALADESESHDPVQRQSSIPLAVADLRLSERPVKPEAAAGGGLKG